MKLNLKRLGVALVTFMSGVVVTIVVWQLWARYQQKVEIEPPYVSLESMLYPAGFPGRSVLISHIKPSAKGYFPAGAWKGYEGRDGFVSEWYAKHLAAMNEPSLLASPSTQREVYRFIWLRTFHHPLAIRLWRENSQAQLVAIELDGRGGYEPGAIIKDKPRRLTEQEWLEFLRLLNQTNYWTMPAEDPEISGFDGAQWILEAVREDRYHLVERWSPRRGEYHAACLYLLKIADIGLAGNDRDVY